MSLKPPTAPPPHHPLHQRTARHRETHPFMLQHHLLFRQNPRNALLAACHNRLQIFHFSLDCPGNRVACAYPAVAATKAPIKEGIFLEGIILSSATLQSRAEVQLAGNCEADHSCKSRASLHTPTAAMVRIGLKKSIVVYPHHFAHKRPAHHDCLLWCSCRRFSKDLKIYLENTNKLQNNCRTDDSPIGPSPRDLSRTGCRC